MITQFMMDGNAYNLHVMSLKRLFEVKDGSSMITMQNGNIHRDLLGTYYNYTLTVRAKDGDMESLDAFWDAVSQPVEFHECVFPYGQSTLTQKMYVKTGNQEIQRLSGDKTLWRDVTIQFYATAPKVLPYD